MVRWGGRVWIAVGALLIGLVLTAAGVLIVRAGLEDADKISSVIGAATGLIGLLLSGVGALRARKIGRERQLEAAESAGSVSWTGPVSMRGKAKGNGRIYQVGQGKMDIHD